MVVEVTVGLVSLPAILTSPHLALNTVIIPGIDDDLNSQFQSQLKFTILNFYELHKQLYLDFHAAKVHVETVIMLTTRVNKPHVHFNI